MNIAEILKDYPRGTSLYSSTFGELRLWYVLSCSLYPIYCKVISSGSIVSFAEDGKRNITDAEPTLFPSKEQRDWSEFGVSDRATDQATDQVTDQKQETELKPFDKVLVRDFDDRKWVCDFFEGIPTSSEYEYSCVLRGLVHQCIPYEGNEHLLGTTKKPEVNNETN